VSHLRAAGHLGVFIKHYHRFCVRGGLVGPARRLPLRAANGTSQTFAPLQQSDSSWRRADVCASAITFFRSMRSFLAPDAVSLKTPTIWWPPRLANARVQYRDLLAASPMHRGLRGGSAYLSDWPPDGWLRWARRLAVGIGPHSATIAGVGAANLIGAMRAAVGCLRLESQGWPAPF
jgi:hypothetical protein